LFSFTGVKELFIWIAEMVVRQNEIFNGTFDFQNSPFRKGSYHSKKQLEFPLLVSSTDLHTTHTLNQVIDVFNRTCKTTATLETTRNNTKSTISNQTNI
jgi:hypothetical protein